MFRLWNWITGGDRGGAWFLAVITVVAIAVPALNQVVPSSSAFHLSAYGITLIGKYLCYGMLALAVDLIWVLRHPEPRARGVFLARRLRNGYVFDATDRTQGRVRRPRVARLHGVSQL